MIGLEAEGSAEGKGSWYHS